MDITVREQSGILKEKIYFFLSRIMSYSIFLLVPFWTQKVSISNQIFQIIYILFYIMFIFGQWYLLGKEVDYRLKIYYRTSSSIDRIVYRALLGSIILIIIFNIFAFFPQGLQPYIFWSFFGFIGLYYSWPTRGKIINESASTQLNEYKFLDSFEKSVLFFIILMVFFTLPELPKFSNTEALKLYIDPNENINIIYWNYINFLFLPFKAYSKLNFLSWCSYFFYVSFGLYLFSFYGILRSFFSRRLALLGVFALVSSWSCMRILDTNFNFILTTTFNICWIWSLLWATRSATYRSGFIVGLILFMSVLYNPNSIYLLPITILVLFRFLLKEKSIWYRKQVIKYMIFGIVLSLIAILNISDDNIRFNPMSFTSFFELIEMFYDHKGFYSLSILGLIAISIYNNQKIQAKVGEFKFDRQKFKEMILLSTIVFVLGFIFDENFIQAFSVLWLIVFLCIIPLEWMFQSITVLRSKRDVIFFFYILVCLMDSHFEGRIKTFFKLLNF